MTTEQTGLDYKKILIMVDFSAYSTPAFYQGLRIAKQFDAEAHVLYVVEPIGALESGFSIKQKAFDMQKLEDHVRWRIDELFKNKGLEAVDRRKVKTAILSGKPYQEGVKYAEENDIDLIVLGSKGRSSFNKIFVGSQSERVLRLSHCQVLIVKSDDENLEEEAEE